MGNARFVLIIVFAVIILLLTDQAAFGSFSDDFSGQVLDSNKWVLNENGGTVSLIDGSLVVDPKVSQTYPYIYTKEEAFGSGDFMFEMKIKLSGPLNYGFGVNVTDHLLSNLTTNELGWSDLIYLFWPDASNHLRLNTVMCPVLEINCILDNYNSAILVDNLNTWLTYKIVQEGNEAKIYRDWILINTLRVGNRKPRYIWIGNPQLTSVVTRGKIEIDFIKIEPVVLSSSKLDPIILIPGFGASWNYQSLFTNTGNGEWAIPNWINTYDNLVDSLQNAGYQKGVDLFVYGYDWRKPLSEQADMLNTYIQSLTAQGKITNDSKLNFVAHSFGGLVARSYLDKYGTTHFGKLITAGSPHQGAALSYKTWSGGEILLGNWWQKSALSLLVGLNIAKGESPVTAVRRLSPSIKNILPTYDYLVDASNVLKPQTAMSQINDYLVSLNSNISNIDASTSAITGDTYTTVEKIKYEQRDWLDQMLGKWQDGRPIEDVSTIHGDGTVTLDSAKGLFSNYKVAELDHGNLVFDSAGIAEIFQKLGLDTNKIVATASATEGNNPIVAILRSPGDLKLVSPSGQTMGMGEISTNSAIVVPDQKLVIIPNPEIGDYQVKVETDGNVGDYSLFAGYTNSNGLELKRIDAKMETGDTDTFLLNMVSNLSTLETTNDPDFVEILLETTSRLDPDLETHPQIKNRLINLKSYLSLTYLDYQNKSPQKQRNTNLETLSQLSKTMGEITSSQNIIYLNDLTGLILAQSSKKTFGEAIDSDLYDTVFQKVSSDEASLQTKTVSTSSAIFLKQLLITKSPVASQSSNPNQDLENLFLKSIFIH